jgi:uncharacterized protein YjbJ (UPF0337 family)
MNQDQLAGKWKQIKGSFKQKWGKFTDDEITRFNGNRDMIVGALQEKYGQTREQAQKEFETWYASQETLESARTSGSGRF